ncbi:RHS repeat domain-containing protein [Marivivens marinus]|uniref:RHS repeat domain-containing protein n=1 Tax=Marivivens marinus TaxID=3110173 RepID=UPI003B845222
MGFCLFVEGSIYILGEAEADIQDADPRIIPRDQLASVQAISNAAGQRATRRRYRPFGEISWEVIEQVTADEAHGFIGERYDEGAGLQYLNARYYDPELGVRRGNAPLGPFLPASLLQPDWFEVTKAGVGTNRYAYSGNDPLNARDPGGNESIAEPYREISRFFGISGWLNPGIAVMKTTVLVEELHFARNSQNSPSPSC